MPNVLERIDEILEVTIQNVQEDRNILPHEKEDFNQVVEEQRNKKLEQIIQPVELLKEELENQTDAAQIEVIENVINTIREAEIPEDALINLEIIKPDISEERWEQLKNEIELKKLKSSIKKIEVLSGKVSLSEDEVEKWKELRKEAEREERIRGIFLPSQAQVDFEADLKWIAAKGEQREINLIPKIRQDSSLASKLTNLSQALLTIAEVEIRKRLRRGTKYRIFCSEETLKNIFSEIEEFLVEEIYITDIYPAFVMVSLSEEASKILIAKIQRHATVEEWRIVISKELKTFPANQYDRGKDPNPKIPLSKMSNQVVEFNAPVRQDWKQKIKDIGATILQPLSRSEIVISAPNEHTVEEIKKFEEVANVTPYSPRIRVQPQFFESLEQIDQEITDEMLAEARLRLANNPNSSPEQSLTIPGILVANFFTKDDRDYAAKILEEQGITIVEQPGTTKLVFDLSSDSDVSKSVDTIVKQPGLEFLEEETIPTLSNEKAVPLVLDGLTPASSPFNLKLKGEGQIIAIADSGLDTGDQTTIHLDFQGRIESITSYPLTGLYQSKVLNPGADDGPADTHSGHGTHVAGSALGNGEQASQLNISTTPSGIAPRAKLIFQAIEQTAKWTNREIFLYLNKGQMPPSEIGLYGIPQDLGELFQEAYDKGARIHANSWGGGRLRIYDRKCQDLDKFVWEHQDFLIVVAAGNEGNHSSSGTRAIDLGSVNSPGVAKNCLTVGASENNRYGQFSDTYGQLEPSKFPHEPFNSNGLVDSIDDIAAFSSRGPCFDNRRKPDVVAPGTFILSTRSSQIESTNFANGVFSQAQDHYMYMHGTSMATPLVAGCAALVREYLQSEKSIQEPSAALVKASLIHSAKYINYCFAHPSSCSFADHEQGWGRINLSSVFLSASINIFFIDISQTQGLVTGDKHIYEITIADPNIPLKATLVYTDYPGLTDDPRASNPTKNLINNLNLSLCSPSGKKYIGNDFNNTGELDSINNVEGVFIKNPEKAKWLVKVTGSDINEERQNYALVISGAISQLDYSHKTH